LVITHEFFAKPVGQEALSKVRLFYLKLARHGDIRVEGHDGRVIKLPGARVKPVEPVSPSANDHDLSEPRLKRGNQTHKVVTLLSKFHCPPF
jgi:hypothetical protein